MNGFQIAFIVMYAVSALCSLYCLSLGDKISTDVYRTKGITGLIGVAIGLPLYLASIGIL